MAKAIIILLFFAGLMSSFGTSHAAWVEWIADAEIDYSFHDNINNSVFDSAKEDEHIFTPYFSLGRIYQLTNFTRLFATVDVAGQIHLDFSRLNNISAGPAVAIRHKLGLGPFVPWVRAEATAALIESRSELRDGQIYTLGVQIGKRFHERVDAMIGYIYDHRDVSDSYEHTHMMETIRDDVYKLRGHKGLTNVNLLVAENLLLTLGYSLRDGDVAATVDSSLISMMEAKAIWMLTDAHAIDDAIPGSAYRVKATTHTFLAGLSYAFLKGHASANIGYQYYNGEASDLTYKNNVFLTSLNYSY
jgi:hypothetical protein